jgi:glycosyltransferase involved in cell wall biosynthesis
MNQALNVALYTEGLPFTGDTLEHRALGGSETAFIYVAKELARMGHKVTAYCLCEREGNFDGVEYRHAMYRDALRSNPCDLFLCSRYFQVFATGVQARCRVLWMHDVLIPPLADELRHLLPSIDLIFHISDYHRRLVAAALPPLVPKLRPTRNGLDLDLIRRVAHNVPKKHKVMYTSCPERGLWDALDIYEALGDRSLEMLVATYVGLDPPYQHRIEELRGRGFPVSAGNFVKADLYRHMAESEALIYPCSFPEVFCISAAEAQACGTVFLTVDDFALRETVAYKSVPRGDVSAFLSRTREVLGSPALRQELEVQGRRHAERYTWKRVAERFVEEMQAFLSGRPPLGLDFLDRVGSSPKRPPITRQAGQDDAALVEYSARCRDRAGRLPARNGASRLSANGVTPEAAGAKPKISCLTVTLGRLGRLKRAIRCYCDQTYPHREMVIVTDAGARERQAIQDYLDSLGRPDIRFVPVDGPRRSLGELRNVSLAAADGGIVCQWDDDDLYHPLRLEQQSAPLIERGEGACLLTDQFHFFEAEKALFWVDWTDGGYVQGIWQLIPGSLMMYRQEFRYPENGPEATRGEDSALLEVICNRVPVLRLAGLGHLYVYTFHGHNTFPFDHHQEQLCRAATREFLTSRKQDLLHAIEYYPLPRPFTVYARGESFLHVGP